MHRGGGYTYIYSLLNNVAVQRYTPAPLALYQSWVWLSGLQHGYGEKLGSNPGSASPQ